MKDYDAYLFDWDGTLGQTLDNWLRILRGQANAYSLQVTDAQITAEFGNWDWALKYGLDSALRDKFVDEVREAAKAQNPLVAMYDDALRALQLLKARGKKLALVSSTPAHVIDIALNHHQLAELFDVIIAGDRVTNHKPHPESIDLALQLLGGIKKSHALMLGDSDKDLLAANNAGIDSLLFYPSLHQLFYDRKYLESLGPRYTITAWQEFIDQLPKEHA